MQPRAAARAPRPAAGILAIAAIALSLRAPITAAPPLAEELQVVLGVSPAAIALLTSIPVLCFGLVTPASSRLLKAMGLRTSGVLCLAGVLIGSVLRSGGTFAMAVLGTVLIGAAVSIGNLVVPVLIGRWYPLRAAGLMGGYTSIMNIGSTAATATTAALAVTFGWPLAMASWGVVLGGAGLLTWLLVVPRAAADPGDTRELAGEPGPASSATTTASRGTFRATLRHPVSILLALAFAAQAMSWYAITAWLPAALADVIGMSAAAAGVGASGFQVAGIVGPLLVPVFLGIARHRRYGAGGSGDSRRDEAVLVALIILLWAALPLGMLLAPGGWVVWVLASGVAQGAFFALLFLVIVQRTSSDDENRRVATFVQTVGYLAAAAAPVAVGWVYSQVEGWNVLFVMVAVLVAVQGACAIAAVLRPGLGAAGAGPGAGAGAGGPGAGAAS